MSCAWTVFTLGKGSGRGSLTAMCFSVQRKMIKICICNDSLLFLCIDFHPKKVTLPNSDKLALFGGASDKGPCEKTDVLVLFNRMHQFLKYTGRMLWQYLHLWLNHLFYENFKYDHSTSLYWFLVLQSNIKLRTFDLTCKSLWLVTQGQSRLEVSNSCGPKTQTCLISLLVF